MRQEQSLKAPPWRTGPAASSTSWAVAQGREDGRGERRFCPLPSRGFSARCTFPSTASRAPFPGPLPGSCGESQTRGSAQRAAGWPLSVKAPLLFTPPKGSGLPRHRVSRQLRRGLRVPAALLLAALLEQVTEPPEPQVPYL